MADEDVLKSFFEAMGAVDKKCPICNKILDGIMDVDYDSDTWKCNTCGWSE